MWMMKVKSQFGVKSLEFGHEKALLKQFLQYFKCFLLPNLVAFLENYSHSFFSANFALMLVIFETTNILIIWKYGLAESKKFFLK